MSALAEGGHRPRALGIVDVRECAHAFEQLVFEI